MQINQVGLKYNDIYLIPQKCIVDSRSSVDISIQLGSFNFKNPVLPANMPSVLDLSTHVKLMQKGYFSIYHRFAENLSFIDKISRDHNIISSVSIGVDNKSYEQLNDSKLQGQKPDIICIDIAHAFCDKTIKMIDFIKKEFKDTYIIAGNVGTFEAVKFLYENKADCIKIGIGGGSVCSTYNKTGFVSPHVTTILDCCQNENIPIIADGGVREVADISKALVLGAKFVMCGKLFAACKDVGSFIEIGDKIYKRYYGSASKHNKSKIMHIEGSCDLLECSISLDNLLSDIDQSLKSSVSYGGGNKLSDLRKVKYGLFHSK